MSDILHLNDGQKKIIEAFIKLQEESNYLRGGISGYDLKKENLVSISTWQDNYPNLEYRQLITEVHRIEARPKKNSRRTTRSKYTFRITPLGFISYLKSLNQIKLDFQLEDEPPYYKQINKLLDLSGLCVILTRKYENFIGFVLEEALKSLQISYLFNDKTTELTELRFMFGNLIEESQNFEFDDYVLSLKKTYNTLSKNEIDYENKHTPKHHKPLALSFDNYNVIQNNIYQKLKFIFYFNLIRLAYDFVYFGRLYDRIYPVSEPESGIIPHLEKVTTEWNGFRKYIPEILKKINSSDFKDTFKQNLNQLNNCFTTPKIITDLVTNFSHTVTSSQDQESTKFHKIQV